MVNAIMVAANSISAVLGAGGGQDSGKALSASLKKLQKMLLPSERDHEGERIERIKKTLQREAAGGVMKVKPMSKPKKKEKAGSFKKV